MAEKTINIERIYQVTGSNETSYNPDGALCPKCRQPALVSSSELKKTICTSCGHVDEHLCPYCGTTKMRAFGPGRTILCSICGYETQY